MRMMRAALGGVVVALVLAPLSLGAVAPASAMVHGTLASGNAQPPALSPHGHWARVGARAKNRKTGSLKVRVTGLPAGAQPRIVIRRVGSARARVIAGPKTVKRLKPGRYQVRGSRFETEIGSARKAQRKVRVKRNRTARVRLNYRWRAFPPTPPANLGSTGLDSGAPYVIVGDWMVGLQSVHTTTMAGFNLATGQRWFADPTTGMPPLGEYDDGHPDVGAYGGRAYLKYRAVKKGSGIVSDTYAEQIVGVDPATGIRTSTCALPDEGTYPSIKVSWVGTAWVSHSSAGYSPRSRYDPSTCSTRWTTQRNSVLHYDAGVSWLFSVDTYSTEAEDSLGAVDPATGVLLWARKELLGHRILGTHRGRVILHDQGNGIFSLDPLTGAIETIREMDARAILDPDDGTLYVDDTYKNKRITAYAEAGRTELWSINGVDPFFDLDLNQACAGRLWLRNPNDGNDYLLRRDSGGSQEVVDRYPEQCLAGSRGVYFGYDGQWEIAPLP